MVDAKPDLCLEVGAQVRVRTATGCRRAVVSYLNPEDGTVDVLFQASEEEGTFPYSCLLALEKFETEPQPAHESTVSLADWLKSNGTVLFKLKDYQAAADYYTEALKLLKSPVLSSGAVALVRPIGRPTRTSPLPVRPALVLAVEAEYADLLYLDDQSEEASVMMSRLVLLLRNQLMPATALYMNLARCMLNLNKPEFSVQYCGRARAAAQAMAAEGDEHAVNQVVVAWFLEAKSHVAARVPKLALAACDAALQLDPLNKDVQQLMIQVQRGKEKRMKSNRKIAREISEWIDATMKESETFAGALAEGGI